MAFSISCTSRAPRGTERNGVEYFFLSPDEFKEKIAAGEFLEYEEVYKNRYYGTLKAQVERQSEAGQNVVFDVDVKEGVNFVFQCLLDPEFGAIKSLSEIDAVGHRIVQGGDLFEKSVIVDKSVEDGIESLCDLAPVHNAGHLKGLRAVDKLMPEVPQVCVFDNAFHSTMPDYAYLYAVPYELYEKYHVRRYGFHGTSHRYVSQRVCEFYGSRA